MPATFPPLDENVSCDVAIIGGGLTGALIAWMLTSAGMSVALLDRREVAHGSTAANTGLLLYESDEMLHRLAGRIGRVPAERAYVRCRSAVAAIERIVRDLGIECEHARKQSLYVAATPAHVPRLQREFEARRAAGLKVAWWSRSRLGAKSSLPHAAAILSPGAAQLDVYLFTYAMLLAAQRAGARICDRTAVMRRKERRGGVELQTSRGRHVRARCVVVATGYEAETALAEHVGTLVSTFAVVSEPIAVDEFKGWPAERCLIWDTADPYLYLRTTADNRAMIGGYDEPFDDAEVRDRLLPVKTAALKRRFHHFFPHIPFEVATAWAGTFGASTDGLPLIGQHRRVPHTWFALGFGGNGTVFSIIAAEIIRAAMLGMPDPDAELFGFARLEH